jgi:hypothetical protein
LVIGVLGTSIHAVETVVVESLKAVEAVVSVEETVGAAETVGAVVLPGYQYTGLQTSMVV